MPPATTLRQIAITNLAVGDQIEAAFPEGARDNDLYDLLDSGDGFAAIDIIDNPGRYRDATGQLMTARHVADRRTLTVADLHRLGTTTLIELALPGTDRVYTMQLSNRRHVRVHATFIDPPPPPAEISDTQQAVLRVLAQHPDGTAVLDLKDTVLRQHAVRPSTLDNLTRRGLIRNDHNRHTITDAGRAALAAAQ